MRAEVGNARQGALRDGLARGDWYHTIELAPGEATRGLVDLRALAPKLLPADMTGARALDVGTFDGFWAFEMERRGAEVVATDVSLMMQAEWPLHTRRRMRERDEFVSRPTGELFAIAHETLGSGVERIECPIHDLDVDRLGGPVDLAVVGWLLLHLRDPVGGLEAVHRVVRPGGRLIVIDQINLWMSLLRRRPQARLRALEAEFDWWVGNPACLRAWLALAGFTAVRRRQLFRLDAVRPMRQWCVALECERP